MGRLDITVHSLDLYPPAFGWREDALISPRVDITVDDTYQFHTKVKKHDFSPNYEEKFVVGNTHRLAMIEILIYGVTETSGFALMREEKQNEERLIARTFVAIGRLVQSQTKTRKYYLSTIPREAENNLFAPPPRGIAGTITLSLYSDSLGEPTHALHLDTNLEQQYVERIKRLFLSCAPEDVAMIDPIISHCRDTTETVRGAASAAQKRLLLSPTAGASADSAAQTAELIALGTRTTLSAAESNLTLKPLQFHRPPTTESFEDLMRRLCEHYRTDEPAPGRLHVRLLGLTNLDREALNTSLLGSDSVVTVLRTPSEVFVAHKESLKETVVYPEDTAIEFDVVDPEHFYVHILVLGRNGSNYYEIGRCNVSVAPLARGHLSPRHMFLTCGDALYTALTFPAVVHLIFEPLDFGLTPLEDVNSVDSFYDRLSSFFRRYDPVRVPSVDMLIRSRLPNLEAFMNDLVVEHGREPGTVRLELTLQCVNSLRESATVDLHAREVMAIVTMGESTITSAVRTVRRFAACHFDECYTFDVVRETDMLRIEIVKASNPSVVYGRVEFTCLNTQRGVANDRVLWLVGEAGTPAAYFSGIVEVSMISQEIGHPYEVDVAYENMMAGRLRRYAYRRIPETIHRVNLAVATVFDMETFMAQLAARYGEEDPSFVVYFTITGCRRLRSRFGGINPYVVARVGVATYETKWVKNNTEPDYFEFCEFSYDRPGDNAVTLVVMDHSDIGEDREIGHAVIPLVNAQVNAQYNDFVSLISPDSKLKNKDIGAVGFKYTVFDTNLVDHTRTRLMQAEARRVSKGHMTGSWVEGDRRVSALHATEEGGGGTMDERQSSFATLNNTASTYSDDAVSHGSSVVPARRSTVKDEPTGARWGRWMNGAWSSLRSGFRSSQGHTSGGGSGVSGVTRLQRGRRQNSSSSGLPRRRQELPSGAVSPEVLSRLPSALSLSSMNSDMSDHGRSTSAHSGRGRAHPASARFPTQNLMDGGIVSIGEFCGHDPAEPGSNSLRTNTDFLLDFNEGSQSRGSSKANSFSSARHERTTSEGSTPPSLPLSLALEPRAGPTTAQPHASRQRSDVVGGVGGHAGHSVHFADVPRLDVTRRVRVRVVCCRNLANNSTQLPNPYILLSTNRESHRTHVEFATLHPQFQCEYSMPIDDPYQDALNITVLSDTPFGSRKLGSCVLSLVNVQRGEYRTRWASLVVRSHQPTAAQQGSICVSLRGENFGLDLVPAADAENRLRERIRSYLVAEHPEQLHLLEWFVGEYTRKEGMMLHSALQRPARFLWGGLRNAAPEGNLRGSIKQQLDSAFGSHRSGGGSKAGRDRTKKEPEASVQITIHDISHLYVNDYLATGSCQVKVSVVEHGRKIAKRSRSVSGTEGHFAFEEEMTMVLKHPSAATSMRFAVTFDNKHKVGMCFASLSDLHRGAAQKRQYMLVVGVTSHAPLITGYLTVSLLSTEHGSAEAPPTEEEERRFERLQRFFAYYLPREVATTALTYASTFNVDAYLSKLVEQHGPEPGAYHLRVTVDRCTDVPLANFLSGRSGVTGGGGSSGVDLLASVAGVGGGASGKGVSGPAPFCIIRCGLQEYRSGVVSGVTEFVFLESFDVTIGLPDRDVVEFILMVHIPAQGRSEEIGRAVVPLDHQICDESNPMHLPIVHNPGTQHAEIMGSVDLVLFTSDFGAEGELREAATTVAVFALSNSTSHTGATASKTDVSNTSPTTGFHTRSASQALVVPPRIRPQARSRLVNPTSGRPTNAVGQPVSPGLDSATGGDAPPYVMFDATHAMVKGSPGRTVTPSPTRVLSSASLASTAGGGGGVGSGSLTSLPTSHASRGQAPASSRNPSLQLAVLGITFANSEVKPTRDLYLRVSVGSQTLFRTKAMPADALTTLQDGAFELKDTSEIGYAMLTLKIGINQLVGSGVLCYADFTLARCAPGTTEIRRLRLYHAETQQFLGICRVQVIMPLIKVVGAERPIKSSAVEPLMDDLASLFATYSRKDLRRIAFTLFRSTDETQLHLALRQQLAPSVVATFYVAVMKVDLAVPIKYCCFVEATVGSYSTHVARRQSAMKGILEYGMSNLEVQKLHFPLARVDVSATDEGNDAITMRLCVYDVATEEKMKKRAPIGSAVLSIRALLSPQLYDMSEPVTVSLVAVDRGKNRAHASLVGSITFQLFPPAFESYPRAVRFPSSALQTVSRAYVRYYLSRIDRFLRHYDPNSLERLHSTVYDNYIQNGKWEVALPKMLTDLVNRWGPEKEPVEPPPVLEPRSSRMIKSVSRSHLVKEATRSELSPAYVQGSRN